MIHSCSKAIPIKPREDDEFVPLRGLKLDISNELYPYLLCHWIHCVWALKPDLASVQSCREAEEELLNSMTLSLLSTVHVQPWEKTIHFKCANHPWGAERLSLKVLLWPCRAGQFKIQCRPSVMLQSTPLQYQPTVMMYY